MACGGVDGMAKVEDDGVAETATGGPSKETDTSTSRGGLGCQARGWR